MRQRTTGTSGSGRRAGTADARTDTRQGGHKGLATAGALILLLPLTLLTLLIAVLSYPAYPIRDRAFLLVLFDAGMALQAGAVAAAWLLAVRYLRRGREGLRRSHRFWMALLAAGAAMGLAGAAVAIEHLMTPRTAADHVGFALLCPAAALAPVWLFLRRERRAS